MKFETKLNYNPAVIRQTVFGYWRRRLGKRAAIAVVALAMALVVLLLVAPESVLVVPLAAILLTTVLTVPLLHLSLYRMLVRSTREVAKVDGGRLSVDETQLAVASRVATNTFAWSLVKEVWQLPDVWLLLFSRSRFIMLPLDSLPAEMQAFIAERVTAAGGKVS